MEDIRELYGELLLLCRNEVCSLHDYRILRESFERVIREKIQLVGLQTTDLAARINYFSNSAALDNKTRNALHTFRLTSNDVLNHRKDPVKEEFLRDVLVVAGVYSRLFETAIPQELLLLLPADGSFSSMKRVKTERIRRMRVSFEYADDTFLYVIPVDEVCEESWKVRYHVAGVNEEFAEGVADYWRHVQLNLLDVTVNQDGTYTPSFIVLEPDYLIDISSLAECYKEYGSHPINYFMNRLVPIDNARPLLLGNIANLFLDEWIHADVEEPDYVDCMKKAFRQYSIELAACEELLEPEKEKAFFNDCRMHFEHIRQTVLQTFKESGYRLDKSDAILEPSYICEALGVQGRLDYMQRDMKSFVEMNSGKAEEYARKNEAYSVCS